MKDGEITDDRRIKGALETINYLTEKGAKVILMSHLGRPDKKYEAKYSLAPVAKKTFAAYWQRSKACRR